MFNLVLVAPEISEILVDTKLILTTELITKLITSTSITAWTFDQSFESLFCCGIA